MLGINVCYYGGNILSHIIHMPAESLRRTTAPEVEVREERQSRDTKSVLRYEDLNEDVKDTLAKEGVYKLDRLKIIGDRYVKIKMISEGGMGEAWTVIDTKTDRLRVAKTMHANLQKYEHAVNRFLREMRALAKNPEERYQTVLEVAHAIRDVMLC